MGNIVKLALKQPNKIDEFIAYSSFDVNPYSNSRVLAINLEETKQELDSLFETKMYERPYLPEYYNPLEELIGELWTSESQDLAYHLTVEKVNRFIPRLTISNNTTFIFKDYKIDMSLVFYYKNDFSRTLYNYSKQFDIIT